MDYERLKDIHKQPPGGWTYRDAALNKLVVAGDFYNLKRMAREMRMRNKIETPKDFDAIIEHDICRRLPDKFVKHRKTAPDKATLLLATVQENTQKLLNRWVKAGRPLVGDDIAKERSNICQYCVDNVRMGCLSCKGLDNWVFQWIGKNRKTGYEDVIHGCRRGGFLLFAGVHFPVELLDSADGSPDKCWRRTKEAKDGDIEQSSKEE